MANISAYAGKKILDWVCGGAAATGPSMQYVGLAVGTPNSTGGSEMGTLTGYLRVTCTFAAAASPAGSVSNQGGMTFGPFSSNGSVLGVLLCDTQTVGSTNIWMFGTLQTARTIQPNDSLTIAPGALVITLS